MWMSETFNVALKPNSDTIWIYREPFVVYSEVLNLWFEIPTGFETDFASVPRVPIIYSIWGGRAHRESGIHDYLFRKNSSPIVSFSKANAVFKEAMIHRKKPWYVTHFMYAGVCAGGYLSYHKRLVKDEL